MKVNIWVDIWHLFSFRETVPKYNIVWVFVLNFGNLYLKGEHCWCDGADWATLKGSQAATSWTPHSKPGSALNPDQGAQGLIQPGPENAQLLWAKSN